MIWVASFDEDDSEDEGRNNYEPNGRNNVGVNQENGVDSSMNTSAQASSSNERWQSVTGDDKVVEVN